MFRISLLLVILPQLVFAQNNAIFVDSAGNVGVGIDAPRARLHVAGNLGVNGIIDLGINQARRAPNAGTIVYGVPDSGSLCIVGAGVDTLSRRVTVWSEGGTKINGPLTVTGNVGVGTTKAPTAKLQVNGRIKDSTGYVTPVGGIIMYSGTYANLFDGSGLGMAGTPVEGWAICNGKNGTPNLLSQFIVGAGPNSSYGNNSGATGGSVMHTLTVDQMPSHTHLGLRNVWGGGKVQSSSNDSWGWNAEYYATTPTGGGQAFDVRPPYYALFYIMKL
jgi:hypothetical protein